MPWLGRAHPGPNGNPERGPCWERCVCSENKTWAKQPGSWGSTPGRAPVPPVPWGAVHADCHQPQARGAQTTGHWTTIQCARQARCRVRIYPCLRERSLEMILPKCSETTSPPGRSLHGGSVHRYLPSPVLLSSLGCPAEQSSEGTAGAAL